MKRMSRAGRKAEMRSILYDRWASGKEDGVTVGFIARKMGGVSSSKLTQMLMEMEREDSEIQSIEFTWGRSYKYKPLEQKPLPMRDLIINGDKKKVAEWIIHWGLLGGDNV